MLDITQVIIRRETPADHREVETLVRDAFYNLYVPGCDEHYIAHVLRDHPDFLPELNLVAELDGQIIGSVMYTKARLTDETGAEKAILSFGPLSVRPSFQRQGVGKKLLETSFEKAVSLGYDTIVIFGHPCNYVARGFVSCKRRNVCLEGDIFPTAMLVKELIPGALDGRKWFYHESPAYEITAEAAQAFDAQFEPRAKEYRLSQEEFYIYSHSSIVR